MLLVHTLIRSFHSLHSLITCSFAHFVRSYVPGIIAHFVRLFTGIRGYIGPSGLGKAYGLAYGPIARFAHMGLGLGLRPASKWLVV